MQIETPLKKTQIEKLKCGEVVYITGYIYTARDAAHKKIIDLIKNNKKLPIDLKNQVIYYCGPCPAKPGQVIGSCGPTTSYRMDSFTPAMLKEGLIGMIGKGQRDQNVIEAIKKYAAVYFGATGGAGALLAQKVKKSKVVAFEELGPEAIRQLWVEEFPVTVIIDSRGENLYNMQKKKYKRT